MVMWGNGLIGWAVALMTVSNVLFLGLVIVGIVVLIRWVDRSARPTPPHDCALLTPPQLLAQRLARGEIDEEEYVRRLHLLDGISAHQSAG